MRFFQPLSQLGLARILAETRTHVPLSPGLISLKKPEQEEGYSAYFNISIPTFDNLVEFPLQLSWILPEKKAERALSNTAVISIQPFYPYFVPETLSSEDYSEYVNSFLSLSELHNQIFTLPISMIDSQMIDQIKETECSLYAVVGLSSFFNNQRKLSKTLVSLREKISPDIALYLPGPVSPSLHSFLVYSGIDFFDNSLAYFTSRKGYFLSNDRVYSTQKHPKCFCPHCSETPPNLFKHNELILKNSLSRVRYSLEEKTLRTLVEKDVHNKVSFSASLRNYDNIYSTSFRSRSPIISSSPMICIGEESLNRPVVSEFRNRVNDRYVPDSSARIILLLPCSAKKPYSFSRSHMLYRGAIKKGGKGIFSILSELIITSPLSVVPRELENLFPARYYDIPVAGQWSSKEINLTSTLLNEVLTHYDKESVVINHTQGEGYDDIVRNIKNKHSFEIINTSLDSSPTSQNSLSVLSQTLQELFSNKFSPQTHAPSAVVKRLKSVANFQYGLGTGDILFSGSIKVKGKYPRDLQIFREKEQIGSLNSKTGYISLYPKTADSISSISNNILEFGTDQVKGSNIFAPGCISADEQILPNDDIFVVFEDKVVATARAIVSGKDMNKMTSGIVAEIKKKLKVKK